MPRFEFAENEVNKDAKIIVSWGKDSSLVELYYQGELIDNRHKLDDYQQGIVFQTPDNQQIAVQFQQTLVGFYQKVWVVLNGKKLSEIKRISLNKHNTSKYFVLLTAVLNAAIASIWWIQTFSPAVAVTLLVVLVEMSLFYLFSRKQFPASQHITFVILLLDTILSFIDYTPRKWLKLAFWVLFFSQTYLKKEDEIPLELQHKIELIGDK